ncbi:MAG: CHRD domain-containing protein, partial [Pseudolabrys sp.]
GSATLTDTQAEDLMAGRWYVNIHTTTHKAGEIRGQVTK